jgi:hypothetical protein
METLVGTGLGRRTLARPPLGLGKHGRLRVTREGQQWVACCRFRQPNGQTVRVERWGSSKTAATNNLQDELRNRAGERTMMLSAGSRWVAHKQRVARAADLPDLIRFALGTGLRISEACGGPDLRPRPRRRARRLRR